jgi:hypothetical protein
MSWQLSVRLAERVLESSRVIPSEEIIALIKRVNPTRLPLSDTEREHGYQIKNRLQNLLLENYGAAFHLAPDPYLPDLLLIKHSSLPSIDACHADLNALSPKALDTVGEGAAARPAVLPAADEAKPAPVKPGGGFSPNDALKNAQLLLERYEYPEAEEILATLRITDADQLPVLVKAARLLGEEMGAYHRAIELLAAQPAQLLKDKAVREILAQSYYGSGMITEAAALFAALPPADLGKSALVAYADISFRNGNLPQAFQLLKLSEGKEGFVTAHAGLSKEVEAAMLDKARPFQQEAEAACARGDLARAQTLLQHALSLYPNFLEARRLAGDIEARVTQAEIARLWAQFDSSEAAAQRLDLLARLLEQDKQHAEKIRTLAARERARQKREVLEERLQSLQAHVAQQNWGPCADIVLWLSHQADEDGCRRACALSPFFSLLFHNKKLQRLPDEEAKELWLRFVRLSGPQEPSETCWDTLLELKPYFHTSALFKAEYDRVLGEQQKKALHEAQQLLDRLDALEDQQEGDQEEGYQEEDQEERESALSEFTFSEVTFNEARRLVAQLRKRTSVLPAEDAYWFKQRAGQVLKRLAPESGDEGNIYDYREILLLGNCAKAAKYRLSHDLPWMKEMIKRVDDEIAELFAISAEPIALIVAPDLVADLSIKPKPSGLDYFCSSQHHLLFREGDEAIVVVDVRNMSATRYRSPRFRELNMLDILPDQDVFLFLDPKDNTLWRATLSGAESRFTAVFRIGDHFSVPAGANITGFFMSSTKDNVYYAFIADGDQVQAVKQSIDQVSTVVSTYEVKGNLQGADRLSWRPDRFLLWTEDSTTVLESNLTPLKNSSRVGTSQGLNCLTIDVSRSQIYALGSGAVNVLNTGLRAVKQFLGAESVDHMEFRTLANVCVEKCTVLVNINGEEMFYNMETNKFSQKFCPESIVHTETPSRWYYLEPDMTKPVILLKDMTEEVESLLAWEVFLSAEEGEDEKACQRFVERLANPEYFSIVKPVNQPENSAAGS